MNMPEISVGILSGKEISFSFLGCYLDLNGILEFSGRWTANFSDEKIILSNQKRNLEVEDGFLFLPEVPDSSSFILHNVRIGVDFHWQREEDQAFAGNLKIIKENGLLTAVNIISVEDYLLSVISSEMSPTSSEEFLKAHAVISRSWLLAQVEKRRSGVKTDMKSDAEMITDDEIIRWYDREDHQNYDVCADDHCQRYQGITKASTPVVQKAVQATMGQVLSYNGTVCDTRYYKCCGGVTELFENVWEPVAHPYLAKVVDNQRHPNGFNLNLENEEAATKWIKGAPEAFCNSSDESILSKVLNDFDLETNDFFRWKVIYTRNELSEILKSRSGIDFGLINNLVPVERGVSGRIIRLRIEGTKKTLTIGKELEIRKSLSRSHLYSSCFIVEKNEADSDTVFTLYGAGWGHGVGLCQIGAAVMGSMGYSYEQILRHYFKEAILEKVY
jgi:stage II sporulation protein D